MKKVVFFVTTLNAGGIENYLLRFLTFYEGQITPIVICKGNAFGELKPAYQKIKNIQLIKLNVGYFNVSSYYKIYSFFKKNKIESVCDFTGNFAGLILLTAKYAGVKTRIAFYRSSEVNFKKTFLRLAYNFFMNKLIVIYATKILSNSKAAFKYFFSMRYKKDARFKVIYNGIDASTFTNVKSYTKNDFKIPDNHFVIGHTGRFDWRKNHKTILKVAEIILEKHADISFILCGKDTDTNLQKQLNTKKMKNNIKIVGFRNNINKILPVFDVFFFPSIIEGQPNSLIEAMVVGLPIVASNIETIKETTPKILHKELINPLDVNSFVKRIEEYYLNEKKRKKTNFSNWAVERFNPEVLFNQFYKEL